MPARGPVIALTAGDPCGIGPEVILKALAISSVSSRARWIIIGDHAVFEHTARRLRRRLPSHATFLNCGHRHRFVPGRSSAEAGRASLAYLDRAIGLWRSGHIHALVTAPVTKWAVARLAAPGFTGQTEYLARAIGAREVVMMFVSDRLRVVVLTRHIPLARVSRALSQSLIRSAVALTHDALKRQFRIRHPRLAFLGLNPHAGEEAQIGAEEQRIMRPALQALRRKGIVCDGPFAADGFFAQPQRYDAVICSYHDQGLIPFKMVARDSGCQLTVGLPLVRTSPDHGSALDIAGRGLAHAGSMIYALRLATQLARRC